MKVNDLSKELNVINKDLIAFFKDNGFKVSSHMQNVTDEMIEMAREHFKKDETEPEQEEVESEPIKETANKKVEEKHVFKQYMPDDMIPCKSVTPWKLVDVSVDKNTIYNWEGYGDVEYVRYRDLQAMKHRNIIKKCKIIIDDADLCYLWRNELGDSYKKFIGVEYPEEFFEVSDDKFKKMLSSAPDTFKEVIKYTAMNMVRNENYPTIHKLNIIDEILGTCIKDFL